MCAQCALTASGLRLLLELLVPDDSLEEVLPAARVLDVLYAHMQPLLDDAVAHSLVDLHADCSRCDVPHETGLTVIELVWHTLLHRSVTSNVHQLADLESLQEGAGADGTALALQ